MNMDEFAEQLNKVVENPRAYGMESCNLCGREQIAFVGVCIPETDGELAKELHTPAGKRRSVIYALCEHCAGDDMQGYGNIEERLLKAMRGELRVMAGIYGRSGENKPGKSKMLAPSVFLVFYSSGQRFKLEGFWAGVKRLPDEKGGCVMAPSIVNTKGEYNIVDPRALVVRADDGTIVYNGRDHIEEMDEGLRSAMPDDWPMKLLEQLKPLWKQQGDNKL